MKKLGTIIFSIFFLLSANTFASEKLSIEKQLVGIVASKIKTFRKIEPYKGKGIREKGQYVLKKEGKKK